MSESDVRQIRAKIGLEFLERESIIRTARGWQVRFHGPRSQQYRRGIQPLFIAFGPHAGLAAPVSQWRLLSVRWR
jgi:hypothetical protein